MTYSQILEALSINFLYHGTSQHKLVSMRKTMVTPPSYWTISTETAKYFSELDSGEDFYSEEDAKPIILKVPFWKFNQIGFSVDKRMIEEPLTWIGSYENLWKLWSKSKKDWKACLNLYGVVEYKLPLLISDDYIL